MAVGVFSLLTGLGVGSFLSVAVTEWLDIAESIRIPGAVTALVAMAVGGGFSILHLSHPFRTYHIPKRLATGVGKEMVLIGITGALTFLFILSSDGPRDPFFADRRRGGLHRRWDRRHDDQGLDVHSRQRSGSPLNLGGGLRL